MKYRKYKKDIRKTIGKNIRMIRIEHNLLIEELAKKAGFKYTKMKKIEKGYYKILITDIFYLGEALNVEITQFFKSL